MEKQQLGDHKTITMIVIRKSSLHILLYLLFFIWPIVPPKKSEMVPRDLRASFLYNKNIGYPIIFRVSV